MHATLTAYIWNQELKYYLLYLIIKINLNDLGILKNATFL
jgi:hypothetical protein